MKLDCINRSLVTLEEFALAIKKLHLIYQNIAASYKVYQLLTHGRWFSRASSTTKTGRHDIAELLLNVALNTKNKIK
jgi:hypothetical protein